MQEENEETKTVKGRGNERGETVIRNALLYIYIYIYIYIYD
jgi:hypothetical protein